MMRLLSVLALSVLVTNNVNARPQYDTEHNLVKLRSFIVGGVGVRGVGTMSIYSDKHIELYGSDLDDESGKLITICEKNASLGFLLRNGRTTLDMAPKVTEVERFHPPSDDGFVPLYVLKGDDALELMDIMYESDSVGFTLSSDCPETEETIPGVIFVEFDTVGLEGLMRRIK